MADLRQTLADALRAADAPAITGIESRRLAVYRELIHANLDGLLRRGFPVLHRLTPAPRWRAWVAAFLAEHRAHTPYFLQIGREFVDWTASRLPAADDPPFLAELAHYEWVEAALAVADIELPPPTHDTLEPLRKVLEQPLALSPLAWPLTYRWAVHRIGPGAIPAAPPVVATELLAYRDRSDSVRFMELNVQAATLLRLLAASPGQSGQTLLGRFAAQAGYPDPAAIAGFGTDLLAQLIAADVVLADPSPPDDPRPSGAVPRTGPVSPASL